MHIKLVEAPAAWNSATRERKHVSTHPDLLTSSRALEGQENSHTLTAQTDGGGPTPGPRPRQPRGAKQERDTVENAACTPLHYPEGPLIRDQCATPKTIVTLERDQSSGTKG